MNARNGADDFDSGHVPALATIAHGVAASWFTSLFAPFGIAFLAFVSGIVGSILGVRLARRPIRTPFLPLVGAAVVLAGAVWNALITALPFVPSLIGPSFALRLGEIGSFCVGCAGVSIGLRALSTRTRAFVGLEVAAFVVIAVQQLAGHRFGSIHRPYEVADVMLLAGQDPSIAFYAFGALGAGVVGLLLVREKSAFRAVYHFAFLGVLLVICLVASITGFLPVPSPEQARSQRDDQSEQQSPSGGGRGSSSSGSSNGKVAVAVVVFHDDYSSPLETYYFRQETFSRFDGPRLALGVDPDLIASPPTRSVEVTQPPPRAVDRVQIATTVGALIRTPRPIGLESPLRYEPQRNTNPQRFSAVYRVTSLAAELPYDELIGRPVGSLSWSDYEKHFYTEPHPDPRYGVLAHEIVDEMLPEELRADPIAQTAAITTWLGREGQYSLHHLQDTGPDPGSEFLFGERIGFCVHFANSAVHLMRALGIPSRVVGGFAVAESERQGGSSLLLMQHMAHAWPEVYVDGEGWMVADVYPQRSLEPPFEPSDVELARLLGEMARGEIPPPPVDPPRSAEVVAELVRSGPKLVRLLGFMLGFVVAALYAAKIGRRFHPRFARSSVLPRSAYRSVVDALAESGLRRARGESREAFAARIAHVAPSFVAVTDALEARAFGGRAYAERVPELVRSASAARRELRRTVPVMRRVVCVLDPISFLTAR